MNQNTIAKYVDPLYLDGSYTSQDKYKKGVRDAYGTRTSTLLLAVRSGPAKEDGRLSRLHA